MFKCDCGQFVNEIKYRNGKKVCKYCDTFSLSGKWERNNAMERSKYAKDILQPGQPGYEEVYGKVKTTK